MPPTISVTGCLLSAMDVILGHRERTIIIPTPTILEEEDMVIVTNDNSTTKEHAHADREISLIGPLVVSPFINLNNLPFTILWSDGCLCHLSEPNFSSKGSMQTTSSRNIQDCCHYDCWGYGSVRGLHWGPSVSVYVSMPELIILPLWRQDTSVWTTVVMHSVHNAFNSPYTRLSTTIAHCILTCESLNAIYKLYLSFVMYNMLWNVDLAPGCRSTSIQM